MSNQTHCEQSRKMANVMLAYSEGKEIEYLDSASNQWAVTTHPSWDWSRYNYRVKPRIYHPKDLPAGKLARIVSWDNNICHIGKIVIRVGYTLIQPGKDPSYWWADFLSIKNINNLQCQLIEGPIELTNLEC